MLKPGRLMPGRWTAATYTSLMVAFRRSHGAQQRPSPTSTTSSHNGSPTESQKLEQAT
jgi:hypothetical protein